MNLQIKNLSVEIEKKVILKNINLNLSSGKIHALMGPNGSGKSTLAQVLMGHPLYRVYNKNNQRPSIKLGSHQLLSLSPDKRAKLGLFLAFQSPVSVPGVNVANLLRTVNSDKNNSVKKIKMSLHNPALNLVEFNELLYNRAKNLNIPPELLRRSLNEDFSGGEKKKLEMLQAEILSPKFAVFDEIDTGLDIDALQIIAERINSLKKKGCGILLITHYQRILKYNRPDFVHILIDGEIKDQGGYRLAERIEKQGYKKWVS